MISRVKDPKIGPASAIAPRLRKAIGTLRRSMLQAAGIGNLTTSQTAVLLRLEQDGPATVSALARAEGVRPQSMRATVASLVAEGHVEGRADQADGRQTIISLTDGFRRWMADGRAARQDWLIRRIEATLTRQEQETLAAAIPLLDRLGEN